MSLIVYSKDSNANIYGIKEIDDIVFKRLMYGEIHKKCRFSIPKENLIKEFGTKINFDQIINEKNNKELEQKKKKLYDLDDNIKKEQNANSDSNINVLMMTEFNEKQLNTYLEIYEENENCLDKFVEFLLMMVYNQVSTEKFRVRKKFNQLLSSISEYWEDSAHCHYTLTDKFNKRKFNNLNYNGFDENTMNNVRSNFESTWDSREINYLSDIIKFNDWKEMCIQKYYVSSKSNFKYEDIIQTFKLIPTEYMKYLFISNMLCSREYCHLILNNKEFLELSKPFFDKYKLVFKYLIGYAWLTLKNEEYHIYHSMTDNDRIVFDIDTAKLLPVYPFSYDDINQNPYASLLIDKKILDVKNNCLSMEMIRDYEKYYGVCGSDEFKRRLKIFVNNGNNTDGVLNCIDWEHCVISGSVMTACGMKRNPLIDICKTDNDMSTITDNDLSNYFFHYYGDSDIDLICNSKSIYDFIEVVNKFVSKAKINYKNISISNIHTGTILLSDEFILNELDNITKLLKNNNDDNTFINVDYIKSNLDDSIIKKYFYSKYYLVWKREQKEFLESKNISYEDELIKDYLKPIPEEEFRLYVFDYELNEDKYIAQDYEKYFYSSETEGEKKIIAKLSESIRFKISSSNFKTFEIFKSRSENFFSVVSRFHMGFVRAFWNGKTVKCLPSYITSMMLQLAVDYKYFASIRDPIEIVNKYRSRGFGVILNSFEKLHMAYYNSCIVKDTQVNAKWIEMYKVNIKSKKSVENIFGIKKSSDDIFKPSKFFMGVPSDCFKNINHDTVSSFDECFASLITPSVVELAKFKAIGDNGKINPLDRKIIDMGWSLLNK